MLLKSVVRQHLLQYPMPIVILHLPSVKQEVKDYIASQILLPIEWLVWEPPDLTKFSVRKENTYHDLQRLFGGGFIADRLPQYRWIFKMHTDLRLQFPLQMDLIAELASRKSPIIQACPSSNYLELNYLNRVIDILKREFQQYAKAHSPSVDWSWV